MAEPSMMQSIREFRILPDSNGTGISSVLATNGYTDQSVERTTSIPFSDIKQPACQQILYWDIYNSRVRLWDLLILVPNAAFLVFLLVRLGPSVHRLRASSSPMFTAFYGLVWLVCIISVLRCIVSMSVNASMEAGNIVDEMLWLILRFFLLSTEASVISFGFCFGYLDSRTSIRRVLICTSFFALGYSAIQGTMELNFEHKAFSVMSADNSTESYDLFAHGGMIFLCTSSAAFFLVYFIILILPLTKVKEKLILPSKPSFYYYVAILAVMNVVQAIGSLLLYQNISHGLCVVDTTVYIYFTMFDPLVYATFLRKFFRSQRSGSLLFSYSNDQVEATPHDSPLRRSTTSQSVVKGLDQGSGDGDDLNISAFDPRPRFSTSSLTASSSPPSRLPTPFLSINSTLHHATY